MKFTSYISLFSVTALLSSCSSAQPGASEGGYGAETKNVPLSALKQTIDPTISALAPQLPYAYYPSRRQIDVAFDRRCCMNRFKSA